MGYNKIMIKRYVWGTCFHTIIQLLLLGGYYYLFATAQIKNTVGQWLTWTIKKCTKDNVSNKSMPISTMQEIKSSLSETYSKLKALLTEVSTPHQHCYVLWWQALLITTSQGAQVLALSQYIIGCSDSWRSLKQLPPYPTSITITSFHK